MDKLFSELPDGGGEDQSECETVGADMDCGEKVVTESDKHVRFETLKCRISPATALSAMSAHSKVCRCCIVACEGKSFFFEAETEN